MPVGAEFGKGDAPPTAGNTTTNINDSRTPTKNSSVMTTPPSKKEPSWMMDAAQNLVRNNLSFSHSYFVVAVIMMDLHIVE